MCTYTLLCEQVDYHLSKSSVDNNRGRSPIPSVAVRLIGTKAQWLISEKIAIEDDFYYGLADLGIGFPEIGVFSLREIHDIADKNRWMLSVTPIYEQYDLDYYLERSRHAGVTVTNTLN